MKKLPGTMYSWSVAAPYLTLVLCSLLYCAPLFTGLDQSGRGDWDQFTFRYMTPRMAMLRDHEFPLWNPYVNGGNVLLAHPHDPAFSPWYLPVLVFGADLGVRVEVVLFVILGTTGMALLLRLWNVSRAGAVLGGMLLMMSAHFTLHVAEGHIEWCALGLMPWVIVCMVKAEKNWRYLLAGAAVIASALLHGSVYILAVFMPLMLLWAALESARSRSWRTLSHAALMLATAMLLGAIVLLPRVEFARANPRPIERVNQVVPAAFSAMLLDPNQADMFRSTRDLVNPPRKELAQCMALPTSDADTQADWQWRRLEVELSTTSDWTDVRFSGVEYVLRIGKDSAENIPPEQLEHTELSKEGLAIKNTPVALATQPDVFTEESPGDSSGMTGLPRRAMMQATLYVRRSRWNNLHIAITRGDRGTTEIVLRHEGTIIGDFKSAGRIYEDRTNRQTFDVSMQTLTNGGLFRGKWIEVEVRMRTSSDWARLEIPGVPYLFAVESPLREAARNTPCQTRPLELRSPDPGRQNVTARAILCVPYPENDDLHLVIHQGVQGRSRLDLAVGGGPITAVRDERNGENHERLVDYTLSRVAIQRIFSPQEKPWRWTLDEMEMTDGWHEYTCYVTWLGLALALLGGVVAAPRHWPLIVVGAAALMIAMNDALPLHFYSILSGLPFYGSLQVSARFLAAVVFTLAIFAGFGLDWLGQVIERFRGATLRRLLTTGALAIVFTELATLSWNVFPEIFVCRPASVPWHENFAQRYATDDVRQSAMYSAHRPYARANSGVLRDYENMSVPRGNIVLEGDPGYRGEVYLARAHGTAQIINWTMSRVTVATEVSSPDRLVLNQNYFIGWKARIRNNHGKTRTEIAESIEGLVSVPLEPGDVKVTLYYLPDSFMWGAWISGLSIIGCLGVCLSVGTTKGKSLATDWRGMAETVVQSSTAKLIIAMVGINAPFALCHPSWPLINLPVVRCLAIALVLLALPGWPLVALAVRRGWLAYASWTARIAVSMSIFVSIVVVTHIIGIVPNSALLWNATWLIANLGMAALRFERIRQTPCAASLSTRCLQDTMIFIAAFVIYFHAATAIVPAMDDHDFETQGTAYGLVHDLVPKLLTDRHTTYYFAHPPLLHACIAGSFLYWNQLDDLQYYNVAWNRNRAASEGRLADKPREEFWRLPDGQLTAELSGAANKDAPAEAPSHHRIVGFEGNAYLVEPPLPTFGSRIPVEEMEVQLLYDRYHHAPHTIATRTPNIFFAALTVALLAAWIARTAGRWWLALLIASVYATSPETFVRSSYGGYFAISQFALLEILFAVEAWSTRPMENRPPTAFRLNGVIAGGFAALACHKLVFLPAAIFFYEGFRQPRAPSIAGRLVRMFLHPIVLGFGVGTLLYWIYGLSINPSVFWQDHVRTHLIDRVLHNNPLKYGGYPSPAGLWSEFCRHTGCLPISLGGTSVPLYLLVPLGLASLGFLARYFVKSRDRLSPAIGTLLPIWLIWIALLSTAFTLIDWRQTKHLSPLLLPLAMAPAAWAGTSRGGRIVVTAVMAAVLLWNLGELQTIAGNFSAFTITPDW